MASQRSRGSVGDGFEEEDECTRVGSITEINSDSDERALAASELLT